MYMYVYISMTMKGFMVREKSQESFTSSTQLYRYLYTYITALFGFTHSCALLNITTQLKAAAASLCCYKHINALVNFPIPACPFQASLHPWQVTMTSDLNYWWDPWCKYGYECQSPTWSQQVKGRAGGTGDGQGCELWEPQSLCDPRETCAATNHPAVQPYLWVAEGVLRGAQVVPCGPGLVSCLQGNPVPGAFLKADIVVLRCAPPQSRLPAGILCLALWALHSSTPPHAPL